MSLVEIAGGGLWVPAPSMKAGTFGDRTLDATAEKLAFIFRVPKTGTFDSVEFRTGTTVSVNAGSAIRVSFQDVGVADGDPAGMIDEYKDIAGAALSANTWTSPGIMSDDGTDTGVKRAVTRGDLVALVWQYETFNGGDDLDIAYVNARGGGSEARLTPYFPYSDYYNVGAWTRTDILHPCVAIKYADGTYAYLGPDLFPAAAASSIVLSSDTSPDEAGIKFQFPFPCKVRGAWLEYSINANCDAELVLYDSDGSTELETIAIDNDILGEVYATENMAILFDDDHELAKDTWYRLTVRALTAAAATVTTIGYTVDAVAILDATEGGRSIYKTHRTDLGAWTDTTTIRLQMGLLISHLDNGAAAQGQSVSRGFTRGMIE